MWRAISISILVVACAACTDRLGRDDTGPDAATPQSIVAARLGPESHLGIKMTPAIRACRDACWGDIPFDACLNQRDGCYGDAKTEIDRRHCRHMTHTCRKTRRLCLQGCWTGGVAPANPLIAPAPEPGDTEPATVDE
jgi:hypothetical protein